ncbi:MAG: hypothetical protein CMJ23_11685 [Phycisphaerae bacterium]|nr:hypothetical protein [Phycisphaerae bacterium]
MGTTSTEGLGNESHRVFVSIRDRLVEGSLERRGHVLDHFRAGRAGAGRRLGKGQGTPIRSAASGPTRLDEGVLESLVSQVAADS